MNTCASIQSSSSKTGLASNNTHIESASNYSHHSSHHSNSIHSPVQHVPGTHAHAHTHKVTVQNKNNNGMATTVPVPQLANPLPLISNSNMGMNMCVGVNGMNIVIPIDQPNYNALLQQMYPSHATQFFNPNMPQTDRYNNNYTASVPVPAMHDDLGDIYGCSIKYDLSNTPPLPSNNGYYAHNSSNRMHHVPLMDLNHISNDHKMTQLNQNKSITSNGAGNNNSNRYRMGVNNINTLNNNNNNNMMNSTMTDATNVIRRNPKLSDDTLMKLSHLRTIDVLMEPKDYNSYRVSVNSKSYKESPY